MTEWKHRIVADHESSKKKMNARLGIDSQSYAYPEGTYGQLDVVNSAQAVPVNLSAIKKNFYAAYHQDGYGINVRSRDPLYLTRIEPHSDWSGEDLVRHIQDKNPYVLMYRQLLWQASWSGRPQLARTYLKSLKDAGASQVVLLGEEARIRETKGDFQGAGRSVNEALSQGKDTSIDKLNQSIVLQRRPLWIPSYTYSDDNRHRKDSIFQQTFIPMPDAKVRAGLDYRYGDFRERNVPNVSYNGAGLSLRTVLNDMHALSIRGMWNWFSSSNIGNTYTGAADINSTWNDNIETDVQGGRSLYDTARAINVGVTENFANVFGRVRQNQDGPWSFSGKLQGANLSDGNTRYGLEAGISRELFPNFRGVYKYDFDNMKKISPNYYSPQQLHQNQLGIGYSSAYGWMRPSITYLPGFGRERGTSTEFIQDLQAEILFRFNERTSMTPSYSYIKTPTYWRNTYNVELKHHF